MAPSVYIDCGLRFVRHRNIASRSTFLSMIDGTCFVAPLHCNCDMHLDERSGRYSYRARALSEYVAP